MTSPKAFRTALHLFVSAAVACSPAAGTSSDSDAAHVGSGSGSSGAEAGARGPDGASGNDGGTGTEASTASDGQGGGVDAAPKCTVKNPMTCSPSQFVFQSPSTYAAPSQGAGEVAVADLNGDCKDDILLAVPGIDGAQALAVFLSNGDGTFAAAVAVPYTNAIDPSTQSPDLAVLADLNGDGFPDLIGYPDLGYSLNQGNGTFGAVQLIPASNAIGDGAALMATGDIDGDGNNDIVLIEGNTLAIFRNTGGKMPGFSEADISISPDAGSVATSVAGLVILDLNGDGKADIAVSGTPGDGLGMPGQVLVLLNNGDGTFAAPLVVASNGGPLAVGDVDGDGKPDLVFTYPTTGDQNTTDSNVGVLINKGKGAFAAPAVYLVPGNSASYIVARDVNGDGKADILTADYDNSEGSVLMNKGDGTFEAAAGLPGATLYSPVGLAVGDFLGNGLGGVAVSTYQGSFQLSTFAGKCL